MRAALIHILSTDEACPQHSKLTDLSSLSEGGSLYYVRICLRRERAFKEPFRSFSNQPEDTMTYAARTSLPEKVYPGCSSEHTTPSSYSSLGTC
mmetsp:Transcript_22970/g.44635  ORF Transcript_22970/g.44635 Transcript_22970/m.44635 type:complete len:94 (+) Transcript_22970:306-587(+)